MELMVEEVKCLGDAFKQFQDLLLLAVVLSSLAVENGAGVVFLFLWMQFLELFRLAFDEVDLSSILPFIGSEALQLGLEFGDFLLQSVDFDVGNVGC